jgi:hypothetical protein
MLGFQDPKTYIYYIIIKKYKAMRKLIGHVALAIWIFISVSLIIINQKLNLNIPLKQITFPIWFPIITFILTDLIGEYIIPFIKNSFKK